MLKSLLEHRLSGLHSIPTFACNRKVLMNVQGSHGCEQAKPARVSLVPQLLATKSLLQLNGPPIVHRHSSLSLLNFVFSSMLIFCVDCSAFVPRTCSNDNVLLRGARTARDSREDVLIRIHNA